MKVVSNEGFKVCNIYFLVNAISRDTTTTANDVATNKTILLVLDCFAPLTAVNCRDALESAVVSARVGDGCLFSVCSSGFDPMLLVCSTWPVFGDEQVSEDFACAISVRAFSIVSDFFPNNLLAILCCISFSFALYSVWALRNLISSVFPATFKLSSRFSMLNNLFKHNSHSSND